MTTSDVSLGVALASRGDAANNFLLLRLAAATAVIYGHSFALAAPCADCHDLVSQTLSYRYSGDLAVHIFFVISGFLVSNSLASRSFGSFVLARVLRLFPGLLAFVLLMALLIGPLLTNSWAEYWRSRDVWEFIWHNATLDSYIGNLPGVFSNSRIPGAVAGTLWTLWVEVRLYLLLAVFGAFGVASNKWLMLTAIIVLAVTAVVWPAYLPVIGWNVDNQRLAAFFAAGVIGYQFRNYIPLRWGLVGLLTLAAAASRTLPSYELAMSALIAYSTLFAAYLPRLPFTQGFQDFSYGIYLYGWPIEQIVHQFDPTLGPYGMTLLSLPLAWAAGAASWYAIERPALRLKRRKVHANATDDLRTHALSTQNEAYDERSSIIETRTKATMWQR